MAEAPSQYNNHFLYTATRDGELGIQELATSVPLMQHAILEACLHSTYPTIKGMAGNMGLKGDQQKILNRFQLKGVATIKKKLRQQHQKKWGKLKSQGKGVEFLANCPVANT